MKDEKLRDRLSEVDLPGSEEEEPEVYALKRAGSGWALNRRDFVAAAAAAAAAMSGNRSESQEQGTAGQKVTCNNVFAHKGDVNALAISPDGRLLASAGGEGTLKLWSLPEGALLKGGGTYPTSFYALAFSPDGKTLVQPG
jgi:WD40 repeat protein